VVCFGFQNWYQLSNQDERFILHPTGKLQMEELLQEQTKGKNFFILSWCIAKKLLNFLLLPIPEGLPVDRNMAIVEYSTPADKAIWLCKYFI